MTDLVGLERGLGRTVLPQGCNVITLAASALSQVAEYISFGRPNHCNRKYLILVALGYRKIMISVAPTK